MHDVLQLDITGLPQAWISVEQAACLVATGSVVWSAGERPLAVLRGGVNSATGRQSVLAVPAIVALRGASRINLFDLTPTFGKGKLIKRDRHTCAYWRRRAGPPRADRGPHRPGQPWRTLELDEYGRSLPRL